MKTIAFACDHAGFPLKEKLIEAMKEMGFTVLDLGPPSADVSVDYPDYALQVVRAILAGDAQFGVLACGTGIGMSIAANRHPSIRAAVCHTELEARVARAHNHANILCLGGRVVAPEFARCCLEAFLTSSPNEEDRHARRVAKLG